MPSFRKDRVAQLVRQVLADLILLKIKDPRVQGVTITEVQMAADLKSARVYYGCMEDGKRETHQKGLEAAEGFLRRQLRQQLDLKYIPSLTFFYDTAFDAYARVDTLLKKIEIPPEQDAE